MEAEYPEPTRQFHCKCQTQNVPVLANISGDADTYICNNHSVVEGTKFLLQGVEYVLTGQFCQDAIEEYFGSQQKIGRRNDNPDIRMFGYNDNTIRIQRSVSCQS